MNNCPLVEDLIPLYIEELVNEESNKFLSEHLHNCKSCKSYYNKLKEDYDDTKNVKGSEKNIEDTIKAVVRYQNKIKLTTIIVSIFAAVFLTLTNSGFLLTIPLLVIVPFLCRIFYKQSLQILIFSFSLSLIGALVLPIGWIMKNLSGINTSVSDIHLSKLSFAFNFAIYSLILSSLAIKAAIILTEKDNNDNLRNRLLPIILTSMIFLSGVFIYSRYVGNPICYLINYSKSDRYVSEKYQKSILQFIEIHFDSHEKAYVAEYFAKYGGESTYSTITFYPNGRVKDDYQTFLENQFIAKTETKINNTLIRALNKDILHVYIHEKNFEVNTLEISKSDEFSGASGKISYSHFVNNKEASKLVYTISIGDTSGTVSTEITKNEFIDKSITILQALKDENLVFNDMTIECYNKSLGLFSVKINTSTTAEDIKNTFTLNIDPKQ